MPSSINFADLRIQWALKHTPSRESINLQYDMDRQANPHNENYPNKRPRRGEAQIVSDLCYEFADTVLTQQYSWSYREWLRSNCSQDQFTQVWKETAR